MKEKTLKKPEPLPLDTLINFPERKGFFEKSTKKIDPKHIGVPNIQFSLTEKNDDREKKFSKQRIKRGFDDSETWSLTDTIANFIAPRLRRFMQVSPATPEGMEPTEWRNAMASMLNAFELISRDDGAWMFSEEENIAVEKGLDLFNEHFFNLWW